MLTETGAGYFKRVVDILSLCEEAEDFVSRRNTKPRGLLKVTMPTAFSRQHIAPYLGDFLQRYSGIELDVHVTDVFVDIIREGFDLAIRIGELEDSSLVARKIASDNRLLCTTPDYLEKHGIPTTLPELDLHNCISTDAHDVWRLDGPDGVAHVRPHGNVRSDSGEFVREAVLAGLGIGLLSTWDIAPRLKSGDLVPVMPHYRGADSVAVYAVYPSREFMPAKVNVLIDYLADLYAPEPYWDKGLDFSKLNLARQPARTAGGRVGKGSALPAR
jgi:DNA-binding transcriptional LysR family regulator